MTYSGHVHTNVLSKNLDPFSGSRELNETTDVHTGV